MFLALPASAQSFSTISNADAAHLMDDPSWSMSFEGNLRYEDRWLMEIDGTESVFGDVGFLGGEQAFAFGYLPNGFDHGGTHLAPGFVGLLLYQGDTGTLETLAGDHRWGDFFSALLSGSTYVESLAMSPEINTLLVKGSSETWVSLWGGYVTGVPSSIGGSWGTPSFFDSVLVGPDSDLSWLRIDDPSLSTGFIVAGGGAFGPDEPKPSLNFEVGARSAAGTVTPEPTSVWLLGTGLLGLAAIGRRRLRNVEGETNG
jgi:hypothetical protein